MGTDVHFDNMNMLRSVIPISHHSKLTLSTSPIYWRKKQTRIATKTSKTKTATGSIGLAAYLKINGSAEKRDAWYSENKNLEIENIRTQTDQKNVEEIKSKIDHLYKLHLSKEFKKLPE